MRMGTSIAALVRAPHLSSAGHRRSANTASITGTSLIATAIGLTGSGGSQFVTMICTSAFHVHFGDSTLGAATTSDFYVPADQYVTFALNDTETHFRAIQNSSNGTLYYYVSS